MYQKTLRMPDLTKPSLRQTIKNLVFVKALKRKLLKVLVLVNALKRKYKCTKKILKLHSPEKLWKEKLLRTLILLKALNTNTADNIKDVTLSGTHNGFCQSFEKKFSIRSVPRKDF